jgi:hypothetical protein
VVVDGSGGSLLVLLLLEVGRESLVGWYGVISWSKRFACPSSYMYIIPSESERLSIDHHEERALSQATETKMEERWPLFAYFSCSVIVRGIKRGWG